MGGFTYRGKSISAFGDVYYAPDENQRSDYASQYETYEQETDGRDGGYRYSSRYESRVFDLSCYYENLTKRALNDLLNWFDRNTSGALVFDDRPYVTYKVSPYKRVEVRDYKEDRGCGVLHHGEMTIHLKAYDPLGRLNVTEEYKDAILDETFLLNDEQQPEPVTLQKNSFLLYNPGTERTPAMIRIAGDVDEQLTITNKTTGQVCVIRGMTRGNTSDAGKALEINAETGRVELVGAERELAFEMHDCGYICLAPCTPFIRELPISYTSGSATITTSGMFTQEMVGQFIYMDGGWRKMMTLISERQMGIDALATRTGSEAAPVVTMNEIELSGGALTELKVTFEPRVR